MWSEFHVTRSANLFIEFRLVILNMDWTDTTSLLRVSLMNFMQEEYKIINPVPKEEMRNSEKSSSCGCVICFLFQESVCYI
jgi:hypothetical protein